MELVHETTHKGINVNFSYFYFNTTCWENWNFIPIISIQSSVHFLTRVSTTLFLPLLRYSSQFRTPALRTLWAQTSPFLSLSNIKPRIKSGSVANTCNPITWETEAGGLPRVQDLSRPLSRNSSQNKKNRFFPQLFYLSGAREKATNKKIGFQSNTSFLPPTPHFLPAWHCSTSKQRLSKHCWAQRLPFWIQLPIFHQSLASRRTKEYSPSSGQRRHFWDSAVASCTYSDTQQTSCADLGPAWWASCILRPEEMEEGNEFSRPHKHTSHTTSGSGILSFLRRRDRV